MQSHFLLDLSRSSEQSPSPMPPPVVQNSGAPSEQKQPSEERPSASLEPVSDTTSGSPVTGKPRKKDRRRRKRLPKINLKDKIIRAAGDESYDSSELSEFEASQSKMESSRKDRLEEKDALTDAATFPVCSWFCSILLSLFLLLTRSGFSCRFPIIY